MFNLKKKASQIAMVSFFLNFSHLSFLLNALYYFFSFIMVTCCYFAPWSVHNVSLFLTVRRSECVYTCFYLS